jgi:hypothetical protein
MVPGQPVESFGRISVPVQVVALTAVVTVLVVVAVAVPILDRVPGTAPLFMLAAIWVLAVSYALPYALVAALVSLPLLRQDVTAFQSPESVRPNVKEVGWHKAALEHAAIGIFYMLLAAFLGGVFVFAGSFGTVPGDVTLPGASLLPGAYLAGFAGLAVGVAYVALQLRRYATVEDSLDSRTRLGTVVLGALIALAPVVAWTVRVMTYQ